MKSLVWMAALTTILGYAGAARAQVPLAINDITIVSQPQPANYQPQGSDLDLADAGKSFDIGCVVGGDGKLQACQAGANTIYDQNFIRIAIANVSQWVVAPRTVDGQLTAGRTLVVTCQFHRTDTVALAAS